MNGAEVLDVARGGVMTFLLVASPLMLVALAAGVVISLLQALTQIQEQTLVYVPKIILVGLGLLLFLPFMGDALAAYMGEIAVRIAVAR